MYGTPGSSTYEETHANINDSTIKIILDNWYKNNLLQYEDKIDRSAGFCGDRVPYISSGSGEGYTYTIGGGMGTSTTIYGAHNRLITNKTPSFECSNSSDLFTTNGSSQGNQALMYPIGLISMDEAWYAGGIRGSNNSSYYLYTNQAYWTISPCNYNSWVNIFDIDSGGWLRGNHGGNMYGVRPVINLSADVTISSGDGTADNPYVVAT